MDEIMIDCLQLFFSQKLAWNNLTSIKYKIYFKQYSELWNMSLLLNTALFCFLFVF